MCASAAHSTVADLVGSFVNAAPDQVHTEYLRLIDSLWDSGTLTGLARPAAPVLVAHLDLVSSDRQGYLAVLLGLLVEAGYPATDGEVTTAVHSGLDRYLDLLGRPTTGEPLASALLYLVAHFPDDGDLILAAADRRALDPDDRSRLERNLRRLNLDDVVLGRVWPSPSEWAMTEEEREFDRRWIRTLSPEQIAAAWESDTRMTLGYSGAKAYWALRNGIPTVVTDSGRHRTTKPRGRLGQDMNIDVFRRHAPVFRCPSCHGGLDFRSGAVRCPSCSARYPTTHGVLDLTASISTRAADDPDDVLQNAATMHSIGQYYETVLRPAFLRLMGSNWGGLVTPSDEDGYLARHVHPVDGPVLDLAAGAGRWTAVLSDTLGDDRIVALDLNMTMLTWLHGRLPRVPTVRASALTLPFVDASLGAVNCWNALQALPDPAAAMAEVGRCLRPGGTLTLMTFRWASDPIYRYFQSSFSGPGFPNGMPLFELDQIKEWLDMAGLSIRDEAVPGTFVIITAERTD